MASHPNGTVTFLFTDVEGSTKLAQANQGTWETIRARHHDILHDAIESNRGYAFQIIGDAFCAAFYTADDALRAALKGQVNLYSEKWHETPLKVRMGLHSGKAEIQPGGEYHGYLAMSHVQRLMSAAHGGQVLISAAAQGLMLEDLPEGVYLRDMGERRLKDLVRPEHIYQLVSVGLPAEFPPIKTLDAYRHNLPTQMTSFIGRAKEMEEVKQAILAHRLLTLTGAGGTGKTRLSLQVAADLLDQFPDGVWFVELAPLTDPHSIPHAILSAVGIPEQPGMSVLQLLTDYLRTKRVLIVLDNCEHLIEASAQLVDSLLDSTSTVNVMATSREALSITGEMVWDVPSLPLPDPKQLTAIDQLSQYEAVQLFLDRARLVHPSFLLTDKNAPVMAQICTRLDGLPLAIELAAAQCRVFTLPEMLARLENHLPLPASSQRDRPDRQRTVSRTIAWSYSLLNPDEKILFRRLSVFAGGFSAAAAEAVAGDSPVDGSFASAGFMEALGSLVGKSLLQSEEREGTMRYRFFETVRQYAEGQLDASGEANRLRARHLDFFLNLAERAEPHITSSERQVWMKQLERERDNLRAALLSSQGTDQELRLVGALRWYWEYAGMVKEGREWAEHAVQTAYRGNSAPDAKALWCAGSLAWLQEDYEAARSLLEASARLWRSLMMQLSSHESHRTVRRGLANALSILGNVAYGQSHFAEACSLKHESSELFRQAGSRWDLALDLHIYGQALLKQNQIERARQVFGESEAAFRQEKDPWGVGVALIDLGLMALQYGDLERAEGFLTESLIAILESPSPWSIANNLSLLGAVAVHKAQAERAVRLLGAAEMLREQAGFGGHAIFHAIVDDALHAVRRELSETDFATQWARGRSLTQEQAIDLALRRAVHSPLPPETGQ